MKLPKRHMAAGFLLGFFSFTLADAAINIARADDEAYIEANRAATEEVIRQSTELSEPEIRGAAEAVIKSNQKDEQ